MEHKSMKLESQHTYSAQDYRKTLKEKLKFLEKEMKGTVETISLRSTTIRDDNGVLSNIPNSILTNNTYLQYNKKERHRVDLTIGIGLNIDIEEFKTYILDFINRQKGILKNPKAQVFSKGINFEESTLKISFWIKDFNKKEKYKSIITNEIRKYVNNRWK